MMKTKQLEAQTATLESIRPERHVGNVEIERMAMQLYELHRDLTEGSDDWFQLGSRAKALWRSIASRALADTCT